MKKWLVYVLGIVTGIVVSFIIILIIGYVRNSGMQGLQLSDEPGDCMEYTKFEVFQVIDHGCALAYGDGRFGDVVLILPDEGQEFYDNQKITVSSTQCAQRVGTFQYDTRIGMSTVPAVRIIDLGEEAPGRISEPEQQTTDGIQLFEKPGDIISRNNFKVVKVLDSGNAIAYEYAKEDYGFEHTTDLKVLFLAKDGEAFYDKQVLRAPKGKVAKQIGVYKHKEFEGGDTKVIPIVAFE